MQSSTVYQRQQQDSMDHRGSAYERSHKHTRILSRKGSAKANKNKPHNKSTQYNFKQINNRKKHRIDRNQ